MKFRAAFEYKENIDENSIDGLRNRIKEKFSLYAKVNGDSSIKNVEINISGRQVEIFYESESDIRYVNFLCESVVDGHDFNDMLSIVSKEGIVHPSTYSLSYDRRR